MTQPTVHATTVAWDGRGLLILGPSGSGKSALALRLMALGARLVADDRTVLDRRGNTLWASAPDATRGLIEARGIGILRADALPSAPVVLAVDLTQPEVERLPPDRHITLHGLAIPLVWRVDASHFDSGLIQVLKAGRAG
ncbi:HPr kinase/phosphorylase [Paracoccus sp. p4-l81]|uniref:HPr kinase/phosphorylase n=1 Tax=Paracoccus sp. p4-l81 TaxID=3342806 RepID=UPI0035B7D660